VTEQNHEKHLPVDLAWQPGESRTRYLTNIVTTTPICSFNYAVSTKDEKQGRVRNGKMVNSELG